MRTWPWPSLRPACLEFGALALNSGPAGAQRDERVRWKMQSAFGSKLTHIGTSGVRFTKNIERLSDGSFQIKFYEPGALVPALECFDAASKGSVEVLLDHARLPHRQDPGTGVLHHGAVRPAATASSSPGRSSAAATSSRTRSTPSTACTRSTAFAIGPETSGWFRNEIKSLDQLKGLKMRFFGLGAQVMQKLGVSTQLLAAADIYPALERGVIDATEFSMPTWTSSSASIRSPRTTIIPAGISRPRSASC